MTLTITQMMIQRKHFTNLLNLKLSIVPKLCYGIMTTIIVIAIAYFAGLLTPNAPKKQKPQKTKPNKEPVVEAKQTDDIQETFEQDLDDFSIEIEEEGLEKEVIEIQEEEDIRRSKLI